MDSKRLDRVWSERYLPIDLWPLILSRVPVKPLLRFRCVSKSWRSLIDDPNFARLHLKSFKNNIQETNLLVVQGVKQQCVIRCSDRFRVNSEILLTLGWKTRLESAFKVWNPSIRKFHEFPSFPEIETSLGDRIKYREIGLGYDLLAKVYKHVRLIYVRDIIHSVAVYSLGTESWRIIQFQGKECSIPLECSKAQFQTSRCGCWKPPASVGVGRNNGDMLTFGNSLVIFIDETGKEKAVIWDKVLCYNPENGELKILK
ncbi:hypothetical protein V2J09_006149 [Rumex salicifolius]